MQRRREEREQEKIQQEEELQFLARERAIAEGVELDKKEELVSSDHVLWSTTAAQIVGYSSCWPLRGCAHEGWEVQALAC